MIFFTAHFVRDAEFAEEIIINMSSGGKLYSSKAFSRVLLKKSSKSCLK